MEGNAGDKACFGWQGPAPTLMELSQDPRIEVTGFVPDLRPYLAEASLAIAPMRYGVGIQNKVLEAMAMATPIITTSATLGALQVRPGQDLFVGDGPEEIAQHALNLLGNAALREQVGQAGRRYVEEHHDWRMTSQNLAEVYRSVIAEQT